MAKETRFFRSSESICEFFFAPLENEDWDPTVPGIIYCGIKDRFPIKKQEVGKGGTGGNDMGGFSNAPPRILFFDESENMVIQVAPYLLSINVFTPEVRWNYFKQLIKFALYQYLEAAGQLEFFKIGLRYVNRFDISDSPANMNKYLSIYPHLPEKLPMNYVENEINLKINYKGSRDFIVLHSEIAEINEQNQSFSLLLDVDFTMEKPQGIKLNHLGKWLDTAHYELNRLFINSLTPISRKLFGIRESEQDSI